VFGILNCSVKLPMHSNLGNVRLLALRALANAFLALTAIPFAACATDQFDMAMVEQGRQIFETIAGVGCKACHGPFAEGKVGPSNRGVNEATIREALAKIGPMQFLREQLADEDIKRVAAYTEWMGQHLLVKALLKRGRFIPEAIGVYPGTPVQLVIENTGSEPATLAADGLSVTAPTIPARDSASIVWTAPQAEGKSTIACSDCKIKEGSLTIEITKAAKPYTPPTQPKVVAKP
jgi:mono/diheme cytochrome c family protein